MAKVGVTVQAGRGARSAPRWFHLPATRADWLQAGFRWLVAGCQAATLVVTWPLWRVHATPPMLPALPLPAADLGVPLLASLGLFLVAPWPGVALHTALLLYALAIDQTRIQPEVVSLALLLWGSLPAPGARLLGRTHLLALWLWAGVNKLLSPGFLHGTAQWVLLGLVPHPPPLLQANVGYLLAGAELGVGLLALVPRTRRLAAFAAAALHLGILADLSPLGHAWNQAVWPWNVALAASGLALIAPWKEGLPRSLAQAHPLARLAALLLLASPAGFYVGVTDAYLAHNLYSSNVPTARVACARGCRPGQQPDEAWAAFNVPFPPEPRLFEQAFRLTCRPGDRLTIADPRWWLRRQGLGERRLACAPPAPGAAMEAPPV
jgi:hypothetical protein